MSSPCPWPAFDAKLAEEEFFRALTLPASKQKSHILKLKISVFLNGGIAASEELTLRDAQIAASLTAARELLWSVVVTRNAADVHILVAKPVCRSVVTGGDYDSGARPLCSAGPFSVWFVSPVLSRRFHDDTPVNVAHAKAAKNRFSSFSVNEKCQFAVSSSVKDRGAVYNHLCESGWMPSLLDVLDFAVCGGKFILPSHFQPQGMSFDRHGDAVAVEFLSESASGLSVRAGSATADLADIITHFYQAMFANEGRVVFSVSDPQSGFARCIELDFDRLFASSFQHFNLEHYVRPSDADKKRKTSVSMLTEMEKRRVRIQSQSSELETDTAPLRFGTLRIQELERDWALDESGAVPEFGAGKSLIFPGIPVLFTWGTPRMFAFAVVGSSGDLDSRPDDAQIFYHPACVAGTVAALTRESLVTFAFVCPDSAQQFAPSYHATMMADLHTRRFVIQSLFPAPGPAVRSKYLELAILLSNSCRCECAVFQDDEFVPKATLENNTTSAALHSVVLNMDKGAECSASDLAGFREIDEAVAVASDAKRYRLSVHGHLTKMIWGRAEMKVLTVALDDFASRNPQRPGALSSLKDSVVNGPTKHKGFLKRLGEWLRSDQSDHQAFSQFCADFAKPFIFEKRNHRYYQSLSAAAVSTASSTAANIPADVKVSILCLYVMLSRHPAKRGDSDFPLHINADVVHFHPEVPPAPGGMLMRRMICVTDFAVPRKRLAVLRATLNSDVVNLVDRLAGEAESYSTGKRKQIALARLGENVDKFLQSVAAAAAAAEEESQPPPHLLEPVVSVPAATSANSPPAVTNQWLGICMIPGWSPQISSASSWPVSESNFNDGLTDAAACDSSDSSDETLTMPVMEQPFFGSPEAAVEVENNMLDANLRACVLMDEMLHRMTPTLPCLDGFARLSDFSNDSSSYLDPRRLDTQLFFASQMGAQQQLHHHHQQQQQRFSSQSHESSLPEIDMMSTAEVSQLFPAPPPATRDAAAATAAILARANDQFLNATHIAALASTRSPHRGQTAARATLRIKPVLMFQVKS